MMDRRDAVPIAGLLMLCSLAFVNLAALPVIEDEGSQLRWISRIVDAGEWLAPLQEGKPLEAWLGVPLVRLGLPLLPALRGLHVLGGMLTVLLTYRLARELGGRRSAFIAGVLIAVCPFVVCMERLALSDIFLCAAGTSVLLCTLRFAAAPSWTKALHLSAALVLAPFCKFPVGFFFLGAPPLAVLMMPADDRRRLVHEGGAFRLLAALAPSMLLAICVAAIAAFRLHRGETPGFGLQDLFGIGMGGYSDIAAIMGIPRMNLAVELAAQLSWPVIAIAAAGLAAASFEHDWRRRWLMALGGSPMIGIGLLADFWFPRYLLFTLPPLTVCAVLGWQTIAQRSVRNRPAIGGAALALCFGFMALQSSRIVLDPATARWSPVDRFQYFSGWNSGYGFPEAAKFILGSTQPATAIFALDGHSADQLQTYLPAPWTRRVTPIVYGPDGGLLRTPAARLENLLSRPSAWIIVPEHLLERYLDSSFGTANAGKVRLNEIAAFDKPGSRERLAIYAVAAVSS